MVVCLTSARFNMKADILRQAGAGSGDDPDTPEDEGWVTKYDPDSGAIIRDWRPPEDDPDTAEDESELEEFKCMARAVVTGSQASENFAKLYDSADFVRIWFPPNVRLSRRDKVTNIRGKKGVIWFEEEDKELLPTVFSVTGVSPIVDPFGNHIENVALLERASVQE